MAGHSNGNSFDANGAGREPRWPVPPWKFGVGAASMTDDRGDI